MEKYLEDKDAWIAKICTLAYHGYFIKAQKLINLGYLVSCNFEQYCLEVLETTSTAHYLFHIPTLNRSYLQYGR